MSLPFGQMLELAGLRQSYMIEFVAAALASSTGHGFSAFEAALITGSGAIAHAYNAYYQAWVHAVQDPAVASVLASNPLPRAFN
jgi:hypothetical protein